MDEKRVNKIIKKLKRVNKIKKNNNNTINVWFATKKIKKFVHLIGSDQFNIFLI